MPTEKEGKTVLMTWGALVRVRPVPPYVTGEVDIYLTEPDFPKQVLHGAAGSETVAALPGTPEWDDFQRTIKEWRMTRRRWLFDFNLQYGIVEWKLPHTDEWLSEPPSDWQPPTDWVGKFFPKKQLAWSNPFDDRRLKYIKYVLIRTDVDANLVDAVIHQEPPITAKEVEASSVPFESGTSEEGP